MTTTTTSIEWFEFTWKQDPDPHRVWAYNVTHAKKLIRDFKVPLEVVAVADVIGQALVYDADEDKIARMTRQHMSMPIILVALPPPHHVEFLIDGVHRVRRAYRLGLHDLMCYTISGALEVACRLNHREAEYLRRHPDYVPPTRE
jgi:hypothetical protein